MFDRKLSSLQQFLMSDTYLLRRLIAPDRYFRTSEPIPFVVGELRSVSQYGVVR